MRMALKHQSVVDKWNTLVLNGAGRAKWTMETIESKITAANVPGIRMSMQEVSQGGLFAAKRPFLICANNTLPDFYLYIGARDYGAHLDVSWYLTVQPRGLKSAFSRYSMGNPLAMSMALDFFRQQDAHAFVTVIHHCVTDTVKELLDDLDQSPASLNTQSKGFLSVW
jgi:hypothetical protein